MEPRPGLPDEASPSSAGRHAEPVQDGPRPAPSECDIRLTLPARAENVALVRHVVGALAEALGMPPTMIEDVKLAVTEACTNVVRHAYEGRDGPLEVMVEPATESLTVIVTDTGRGLRPGPTSDGAGLGLPLIAALAAELEIDEELGRGSRLRMEFRSAGTVGTA
jgi:serine/threonine-protein kinase RsbW